MELWATLKSLGRAGLAELVERTCAHAQRFAAGLRAAGCEVLNEVVINQVLVSFGNASKTEGVIRPARRRYLLVRRTRVARKNCDAHQRVVVGHNERRRRPKPRSGSTSCAHRLLEPGITSACFGRNSCPYSERCSLRFYSGCLDDMLCAFALLQDEARKLGLRHAHPIGSVLF